MAVARGDALVGDGHAGQRDRQDDRGRDGPAHPAGDEDRPVREQQAGQTGEDQRAEGADLDPAPAVRVAEHAPDEQDDRAEDGDDEQELLDVGPSADSLLDRREARVEDTRIQAGGGQRQGRDHQGPGIARVLVRGLG